MIRKDKYLLIAFMALCCIAWASCKQERAICLTPKTANFTVETMHITFAGDTAFVDTALASARFVNLPRVDTLISSQASTFTISLSPDTPYCQWLFKSDTLKTVYDTLTMFYKRNLQFLSNACGYTFFYNLDSVHCTHYSLQTPQFSIDSVHIVNPSVTNNANTTKNLRIYIHPDF